MILLISKLIIIINNIANIITYKVRNKDIWNRYIRELCMSKGWLWNDKWKSHEILCRDCPHVEIASFMLEEALWKKGKMVSWDMPEVSIAGTFQR